MTKIYVKPLKKELKIYKPDQTVLPFDGEYVEEDNYWYRRVRDNEVEIIKNPQKQKNEGNK